MKKTLIIIGSILVAVLLIIWAVNSSAKKAESKRLNNIAWCEDSAYDTYVSDWNGQCKLEGKGDDCSLAHFQAESFDAQYDKALDRCIEKYAK